MRLCTDGYLDLRDNRRVRTPGKFDRYIEPAPEREALDFLFSHVFPNHRRIVRPISIGERRAMKLAIVAGSVGERDDPRGSGMAIHDPRPCLHPLFWTVRR